MLAAFGGTNPQVLAYCAVFLITGIVTTCANQLLFYQGAGETWSMLIPFFNYLGLALSGVFVGRQKSAIKKDVDVPTQAMSVARIGPFKISNSTYILCTTALDILGLIAILLGIEFAGSGLFTVISSSDIGWAAIMSRLAVGSSINRLQWAGVVVVMVGLAASAGEEISTPDHPIFLVFGCAMSLLSAVIFAADNVLSEVVMSHPNAPDAKDAAVRMGTIATSIIGVYLLFYTLPNWTELVMDPIHQAGGNISVIVITYAFMMFSQMMHTLAYFKVLGSIGAVAAGILNGLRAVGVFIASGMFFCNLQETQCLTLGRVLCCGVVISGVFLYSFASVDENPSPSGKGSPVTIASPPLSPLNVVAIARASSPAGATQRLHSNVSKTSQTVQVTGDFEEIAV